MVISGVPLYIFLAQIPENKILVLSFTKTNVCNTVQILWCGSLLFTVQKSNVFLDLAAFLELNLLIIFNAGLLLCANQKMHIMI